MVKRDKLSGPPRLKSQSGARGGGDCSPYYNLVVFLEIKEA